MSLLITIFAKPTQKRPSMCVFYRFLFEQRKTALPLHRRKTRYLLNSVYFRYYFKKSCYDKAC